MYRYLPLLLVIVLIPGCGLLYDLFYRETGSPELKVFESEKELTDYFNDQINTRNSQLYDFDTLARSDEGAFDAPTGASDMDDSAGGDQSISPDPGAPSGENSDGGETDGSAGDYSETTIQEEGVDEADVVKTDGTYLYTIHSSWDQSILRITRVSPPEQLALLSEVSLEGHGQEIYLYDGKVVALTQTSGGFFGYLGGLQVVDSEPLPDVDVVPAEVSEGSPGDEGDVVDSVLTPAVDVEPSLVTTVDAELVTDDTAPGIDWEYRYERPRTIVTIVDASVPEAPTVLSQSKFDGSQYSNRMIDGVLHLVLANYQDYYYDVMPLLGRAELDVDAVDVHALLPDYEYTGTDGEDSGDIVTWQELYRPTDPDGFGVVTIVSLDVDDRAAFSAVGVVAQPGLIYSSLNALYLTDTEYTFNGASRETTDIYKIAYLDRGTLPVATGTIPGRILNQYSMGEYAEHLRVATTVSGSFSLFDVRTEPYNNVYVLGQTGTTLDIVGSIENIASGETIQSARFAGDRGYVVTFEQIDPLFTLDLSDPKNPHVVGELKVPGFSTFLVPMDADHILAVGQYIPDEGPFFGWGVQLSIFDVSDFAVPKEMAKVVLGQGGNGYSEALYNPKAFTYFAERGLVALPITVYEDLIFFDLEEDVVGVTVTTDPDIPVTDGGDDSDVAPPPDDTINLIEPYQPEGFEGLVVFSVSATDGFTELGRISTRFDEGYSWSSFTRGVFIGDDVFAVTDHGVRGAPLGDLTTTPYELAFESPTQPEEPWPADGVVDGTEAPVDD